MTIAPSSVTSSFCNTTVSPSLHITLCISLGLLFPYMSPYVFNSSLINSYVHSLSFTYPNPRSSFFFSNFFFLHIVSFSYQSRNIHTINGSLFIIISSYILMSLGFCQYFLFLLLHAFPLLFLSSCLSHFSYLIHTSILTRMTKVFIVLTHYPSFLPLLIHFFSFSLT